MDPAPAAALGPDPHRVERRHRALRALLPGHDVETVDNAVDVGRFTQASPGTEPVVLLFLGTLSVRKGLYDLAAAAQRLRVRDDLPPWRLRVVGGAAEVGEQEAEAIREAFRARGLQDRLVGPLAGDAVVQALGAASVFVLPSHWEGQPMVILEAMSAGLPVVSTTVGAIPDVVSDGEGVLVAPHDVEALSGALADLLRDADARVRLGEGARKRAEAAHDMPVLGRPARGALRRGHPPVRLVVVAEDAPDASPETGDGSR